MGSGAKPRAQRGLGDDLDGPALRDETSLHFVDSSAAPHHPPAAGEYPPGPVVNCPGRTPPHGLPTRGRATWLYPTFRDLLSRSVVARVAFPSRWRTLMRFRKAIGTLLGALALLSGFAYADDANAAEVLKIGTLAPKSSPWGKVFTGLGKRPSKRRAVGPSSSSS